jgi:glycerol-3-phosphate dehydrogenase subunit B
LNGRTGLPGPVRASHAEPQAAYDVIVVGAGLAGLFAGWLAARRGARVLVLARGQGNLQLGAGTIDIWARNAEGEPVPDPLAELARLADSPLTGTVHTGTPHPLLLAGLPALRAALDALQSLFTSANYPLAGQLDHNHFLPTALGAVRPTCLVPESFMAGELRQPAEIVLADLPGFRDFYAAYAAANLRAASYAARSLPLTLPRAPARRDLYASDLARLIDTDGYRASLADAWRPSLAGVSRLGLPAILGLAAPADAWRDLSDRLGVELFEIPILPPSAPGMRLYNVLRDAVEAAGGRVTIGPAVRGWLPGAATTGAAVIGVVADTAGGPRHYSAKAVILATGGFRHGGLVAPGPNHAVETVFDLPVLTGAEWFEPVYWRSHPYTRFGVVVNDNMQPVDAAGLPLYPNLWAAGGLLAGADRIGEGCREGLDMATAWRAVSQLTLSGLSPISS